MQRSIPAFGLFQLRSASVSLHEVRLADFLLELQVKILAIPRKELRTSGFFLHRRSHTSINVFELSDSISGSLQQL